MSGRNQKIGQWGETVAADHLKTHGYSVVGRNARTPHGEIDILAEKDSITSFVEVKTRTSNRYGPPGIAVTPCKQEHMLAAAEHYAIKHKIDHWQIDVIAVERKRNSTPEVIHFENAI